MEALSRLEKGASHWLRDSRIPCPPWVQRFAVFRNPSAAEVKEVLAEFTPHFVQMEKHQQVNEEIERFMASLK